MIAGSLGIVVNPASGKDVRRLVARASVFDNQEKTAIVRRAVVGALAAGVRRVFYLPDTHGIAAAALSEFQVELEAVPVESPGTGTALDTRRAAAALRELGSVAVLTLGGDGTNRAFVGGWRDAPLLPVSTGTNNVFPQLVEATVAGAAAGLIAAGHVALTEASTVAKVITVDVDGESPDLALIDAVLSRQRFIGSRALLDADQLEVALLTRAEPGAVGMTAIGGLIHPVSKTPDHGLLVTLGADGTPLRAPLAPGLYQEVGIRAVRTVPFGEPIEVMGPGTLAFDGERERTLKAGQRAWLRLGRDGPRVIDAQRTLELAACRGVFHSQAIGEAHAH